MISILILTGTFGILAGLIWLLAFCCSKKVNPNESDEVNMIQWVITGFLVVMFVGCLLYSGSWVWTRLF